MSAYKVTLVNIDPDGNYLQEIMPINDALIAILRFARRHPESTCRIELQHTEPVVAAYPDPTSS